jgi:hypothetical protein
MYNRVASSSALDKSHEKQVAGRALTLGYNSCLDSSIRSLSSISDSGGIPGNHSF